MNWVIEWLRIHPVAYPAILFVLACLVSIYGPNIKRFIHEWPRAGSTLRSMARNSIANRLSLLKDLQPGNTYSLVFYLASQFVSSVVNATVLAVGLSIVAAVLHKNFAFTTYLALIAGNFTARCNEIRRVLVELGHYQESIAELEKRLTSLPEAK